MRRVLVLLLLPSLALAQGLGAGGLKKIGGNASNGNINTNPTFATQAAVNLFVDSTGNDSNTCTAAGTSACKTIQGAVGKLPLILNQKATVTVAAGNFVGAYLPSFLSNIATAGATSPGGLTIIGTVGASTLAGGLQTGTVASATAGTASSATWGTATVTAAGWTVNDLKGRFISIDSGTGAGQYKVISSNTATVITILGAWTAPTGATFSIVEPTTIINTGDTFSNAFGFHAFGSVGGSADLAVPGITFDKMKISVARGAWIETDGVTQFQNMQFTGNNHGIAVASSQNTLVVNNSYFVGETSGTAMGMRVNGGKVFATGNVFSGAGICLGEEFAAANSWIAATNNFFTACTTSAVRTSGFYFATGERVDCVTPGTRVGYTHAYFNAAPGQLTIQATDISNCGTGIVGTDPGPPVALIGVVSGTSNTVAISLTTGASAKISSTATLTGSTEVTLDGNGYAFATMQAAVPKVIQDMSYGTKFYQ